MSLKIGDMELATPGDVLVGGLAYGITFAVDAFFFSGGATSAESAGAAAAGALGAKYAIQEGLWRWKNRRKKGTEREKSK